MSLSSAGGLVSTLVVFRNNISHARYNEARGHLALMKNALRTTAAIVISSGVGVKDGPRAETYKLETREILKQLQVLL